MSSSLRRKSLDQLDRVLHKFEQESVVVGSAQTYASLLRQCGIARALSHGRRVHAQIAASGLSQDGFLGDLLVQMYGKCGSLEDARAVFDGLSRKNVFSWNFMIRAYARSKQHAKEALALYRRMEPEGVQPDVATFASVLSACATVGALDEGKAIHARIIASGGFRSRVFVHNALINMYAKCRSLEVARGVFDHMQDRDVFSWTAMITAYAQNGHFREAIDLYEKMDSEGVHPDGVTFATALGACATVGDLEQGKAIHERVIKSGFDSDVVVETALVNMYAKCGEVDVARSVFDKIQHRDLVAWNAMVAAYAQTGHFHQALELYEQMNSQRVEPNGVTYASLVGACSSLGDLERGKQIHARIVESGFETDIVVQNVLVSMYARCGHLEEARKLFEKMPRRDVVSWNAMIGGYAQQGDGRQALALYKNMDTEPDSITFASTLGACSCLADLAEGKAIHERVTASGYEASTIVQNSLVDMYAKCGSLDDARRVFDRMEEKNVVSWTAMIAGYVQQGQGREALRLYKIMDLQGVQPNDVTFVNVLGACALGDLEAGKAVHARIAASGFDSAVLVHAAVVNMYAKCGEMEIAKAVFEGMQKKDVVTWTTMVAAYAQEGHGREALDMYQQMEAAGVQPNEITFTSLLAACAKLGDLASGKAVHERVVAAGFGSGIILQNVLINMYARCGVSDAARRVFDAIGEGKDLVSWNAMITAYALNGHAREALRLYREMESQMLQADEVTMVSVLGACAVLGALEEGKAIHASIVAKGTLSPPMQNALVNMYAKCGSFELARSVFDETKAKDVISWSTIICVYAHSGHVEEALDLYQQMSFMGVQPNEITFISILIACSRGGLVDRGRECFFAMVADYGLSPIVEHYVCMIDLLGRAGRLADAEELIGSMPFQPNAVSWMALLGACKVHTDDERAKRAAAKVVELDPGNTAPYVLLSNIYSATQGQVDLASLKSWIEAEAMPEVADQSLVGE